MRPKERPVVVPFESIRDCPVYEFGDGPDTKKGNKGKGKALVNVTGFGDAEINRNQMNEEELGLVLPIWSSRFSQAELWFTLGREPIS